MGYRATSHRDLEVPRLETDGARGGAARVSAKDATETVAKAMGQ